MDKLELKKNLYNICLSRQNEMIFHLKDLMAEAQQSANEYGSPKDRYDSYRMQLLRKRDMYGIQLENAIIEMNILKRIDVSKINNEVGFGAVVVTNDKKLFISISMGKIDFENEVYYAVSVKVPFFEAIKWKKKGDIFVFNGIQNQIIDVY